MTWICPMEAGLGALDFGPIWDAIVSGSSAIDPALPDVLRMVREAIELERRPGGLLDPNSHSGFKISDLRRPLQMYLGVRRHPWALVAVPAGIVALAFLLGRQSR